MAAGRGGRAPLQAADPAAGQRDPATHKLYCRAEATRHPRTEPRAGRRKGRRKEKFLAPQARGRAAPRAPSRPPSGPGPRALTMSYTLRITSWFAIAGGPRAPRARWLLPWGGAAQAGGGAVGTPGGRFLLVPPVAAGRGGAAGTMEPPPRRNGARPAGGALSPRPGPGGGERAPPRRRQREKRGERERRLPGGPGTAGARQAGSPSDGRKMEPLEPAPTFRQERDGGDYSSRRAARLPACPAPPAPRRSAVPRGRGAPCRAAGVPGAAAVGRAVPVCSLRSIRAARSAGGNGSRCLSSYRRRALRLLLRLAAGTEPGSYKPEVW